ncbi:MobF family relaxase [Silanimonas sp.]|uniref:MobF family relaxase n=1 Tax=Silanimonas sp. TaxID=1929290 RepID=UPI0022C180E5|nr:MobF family relaxase [Silanimonas sp.]MCZ8063995.1 relaxase domain-containing protein [Silanimonas sp.]
MLSVKKIHASNAGAAARYFAGYYADADSEAVGDSEGAANGEPPGQFHGEGARALGLSGVVSRSDIESLAKGVHPKTGEQLVRVNADRIISGRERKAVSAYDLTFSAPKSVSSVWAAGSRDQREAITRAHEAAVAKALDYYKQHGVSFRTGAGGAVVQRGEPVIATFEHSTSRANDPQLHTHSLVFAVGVREDGGISRATVDMGQIHAAGAVYRATLAHELQQRGYSIERVDPKQGFFKIGGVPDDLEHLWSKRRAQVEAVLSAEGKRDAKTSAKAAEVSRGGKENPDRGSNFERWADEAKKHGFGPEEIEAIRRRGQSLGPAEPGKSDAELIAEAMDKTVVLSEGKLARAVYSDAAGRYGPDEAQARFERLRDSMIRLERPKDGRTEVRYTTQDVLDREARIAHNAEALVGDRRHGIRAAAVDAAIARVNKSLAKKSPGAAMTPQQEAMVRGAADDRGLVMVQGHAGAGKTFTMKSVVDLYQDAGYRVIGTSTSGKAAQVLGRDAGIDAETIASLKLKIENGKVELDDRTVVIVDEAGMVSSADMDLLLAEARAKGSKVILVGDTEQLAPVDAGRPFEDLQKTHGALELSEVRRQKDHADREIGRAIREGRTEDAVTSMKSRGQWHVGGRIADVRSAMATDYADRRAGGHDALMVAAKRADVRALNDSARAALRERGVIRGRDVAVDTETGPKAFAAGDRVLFRVNDSVTGTKNGTIGEVEAINARRMVVRLGDGERLTLRLDAAERLPKAQAKEAELTAKLTELREAGKAAFEARKGRSKAPDAVAKEISEREARTRKIAKLSSELEATSKDRRSLEGESKALAKIDHGHAITVHKSQGETVRAGAPVRDRPELGNGGDVLVLARGDALESQQLGYVAATRNEGQAHIYLRQDDEEAVIEQLGKRQEKASVNDYEAKDSQEQDRPNKREAGREAEPATAANRQSDDAWRNREEEFWAHRDAWMERRLEEAAERQREEKGRDPGADRAQVGAAPLSPTELAAARARGAAAFHDRADSLEANARFGERGGIFGNVSKTETERSISVSQDGSTLHLDQDHFERQAVREAREAKSKEILQQSASKAVEKEAFDKKANQASIELDTEIYRLKNSNDPLERARGERAEEARNKLHEAGKAGNFRGYQEGVIDLRDSLAKMKQQASDRDPFAQKAEANDPANYQKIRDEIAELRANGGARQTMRADRLEAGLSESFEREVRGERYGAQSARAQLASSIDEDRKRDRADRSAVAQDAGTSTPAQEQGAPPAPSSEPSATPSKKQDHDHE